MCKVKDHNHIIRFAFFHGLRCVGKSGVPLMISNYIISNYSLLSVEDIDHFISTIDEYDKSFEEGYLADDWYELKEYLVAQKKLGGR